MSDVTKKENVPDEEPVPLESILVTTESNAPKNEKVEVIDFDPNVTPGQHYIIVTSRDAAASLGVGETVDGDTGEPSTKRLRIEGEDGQAYILTVSDESGGTATQTEKGVEVSSAEIVKQTVCIDGLVTGCPKRLLGGSDVSQAWFTTRDDKTALRYKGACWKQGQWTKEEVEILQENINNYCKEHNISDPTEVIFEMSKDERKDFYRTIARGLQRPLFSVYRRVTRMYDQKNHIGKYTPEEMTRLRDLRMKHGNDWSAIGGALGRSASSVKDKCRLMKDTCNSGKWLPEEERRLSAAVYELAGVQPGENVTQGLSWALVAERVSTRSEKQCRTKWLNYLNWKQQGGTEWTREDDIDLILKISSLGLHEETDIDWSTLAKDWPSVRSPQWLRGKWWSLKRHVADYSLLPFQDLLDYLKTLHLQDVRMKGTLGGNVRFSRMDLPHAAEQNEIFHIPVSLQTGGTVEGTIGEGDGTFHAYEVLQQLTPTSTGAFIITQPQNNPALSLAGMAVGTMATDHIIVHTLPTTLRGNENVTVQMNPQPHVIISTATTSDEVTEGVVTLDNSAIGSSIQLADALGHSQDLQIQSLGSSDSLSGENEITQSGLDSHGHMNSQEQLITTVDGFESRSSHITPDSEVSQSGIVSSSADLVMVNSASPQFVQSTSNDGELISDPMLTSNGSDLIGSSSDVEADKGNGNDNDNDLTDEINETEH